MRYIFIPVFLTIFSAMVSGCGGGSTTISPNLDSNSSGTGTGSGGGNPGIPTGGVTGTITLQWSAPTTRTDNSAVSLSEITGYRLYYGTSATNTPYYVNISGGSTTQYTITLPQGSYYFSISAIDSNGYEGLKSAAKQDTI